MQLILLCGGSGKRLWPLSNDARSKQFLPILPAPYGGKESMIQRVNRQILSSDFTSHVVIATNADQQDNIISQLGESVDVVIEPERRDTFPAIALASSYLSFIRNCPPEETVVVMPCDTYVDDSYFYILSRMAEAVTNSVADIVLMGIQPTSASEKFGYIVPDLDSIAKQAMDIVPVKHFSEKPDAKKALTLLAENAMWNGGVFAFRLGYIIRIVEKYVKATSYEELVSRYAEFPKISFDYEVVEKTKSVAVVRYDGTWKDLGTWNALCEELPKQYIGKVVAGQHNKNVHVINELSLPVFVDGLKDIVVAASADGILVCDKETSERIKDYTRQFTSRPMYEERRWGTYRVLDSATYLGGQESLTKIITLQADKHISYQIHHHRSEVWTIVDGYGEFVLDGTRMYVSAGDVLNIPIGSFHAIKAGGVPLTFIEVQLGSPLIEEDIERFEYHWQ